MSCLANDESLDRGAVPAPPEEDKSQIKSGDPNQKHKGKQPYEYERKMFVKMMRSSFMQLQVRYTLMKSIKTPR